MSKEARAGAEPTGRRWDPVLVVGALLVLLQTGVRAGIVLRSFYWQDDFVHLDLARRLGLSRAFVVHDHNGHLEMGVNVVYWLLGRYASLSFLPAALCLLALQLLASCLLLAVLRQLFGRSPWVLVPFAGYLFTPLGLAVATWWAAGLEALPLQVTMLTAVLGAVRAVRADSPSSAWAWAALSAAGTALGLFFYEKAVLVLPVVVAVLLLVEWAGQPLRRRLRLLGGATRYLVPHAVLIAAYVALYLAVVGIDRGNAAPVGAPNPAPGTAVARTVFRMLLPGVFGGPWTADGADNTIAPDTGNGLAAFFVVLTLAVVGVSIRLRGRRALQGWLLVVGYLAVDLLLVQVGRSQYLYLAARDPRYVTDALPIIAIGWCAAFSGPLVGRRVPRLVARGTRSAVAALVAGALLVGSGLVTGSLIAGGLQHRPTRDFLLTLLRSMDEAPDASVISTRPPAFVSVFPAPYMADLYRAIGQQRPFDRPGTDLRMYVEPGILGSITLLDPLLQSSGPAPGCGWPVGGADLTLGDLAGPTAGPEVLRVRYVTDRPVTLHLAVGGAEQVLDLAPGAGTAGFVVTGQRGPVTARTTATGPATLCLDEVVVGTPWPEGVTMTPAGPP